MTNPAKTPRGSGRLIAVEGIDGSGKSTVAARLAEHLCAAGRPAVVLRPVAAGHPYLAGLRSAAELSGTATAGILPGLDIYALFLTYSFTGMVADEVIPAIADGVTVVCDRYLSSHQVNQAVFGAELSALTPLMDVLPRPDRTLHLRIEPKNALERIEARGGAEGVFDRYELLARAAAEFDVLLADEPGTRIVDAEAPIHAVLATSIAELDALW
ncbi:MULTISPECIES: hypothetical protein [unclassified Streptomyces]|uniref:dTMP kinase n=1 Tax=unclassified Streptomyces TaxID=2593676 RepID=UPI0023667037|nr:MULTISPECIES: hypothetical protein [unclassified Streptomyces]MDF3141160.1 hypothetical protein [Streptomyces sp. T21Q-yed]WDF41413.1 hypothetical protein PBV52_33800 [Streptomyces sp. T12]